MIVQFAWINVKIKYKGTYLGLLWMALEPLLFFIFLYLVFTSIRIGRQEDFGVYLITGIVLYHTFVRGTQGGLASLRGNFGILTSMNIRREFFPVVSATTSSLMLIVEVGVLFSIMPIFGFIPSWTIVFFPLVLILLQIFVLGMSYILSIAFVFMRDIQPVWAVFTHALVFITPIFWYVEDVGGIVLEIQKINPLGQLIELAHKVVVFGEVPSLNEWLYTTAVVFGVLFVGYAIFQRYEKYVVERM